MNNRKIIYCNQGANKTNLCTITKHTVYYKKGSSLNVLSKDN